MMKQTGPKKLHLNEPSKFNQQLNNTNQLIYSVSREPIKMSAVYHKGSTKVCLVKCAYFFSVPYPPELTSAEMATITAGTP